MAYTKQEILTAIQGLHNSSDISNTTVIEAIKRNVIDGNITEDEVSNIIDAIYPPTVDEQGIVISRHELFTTDELKAIRIEEANKACNARIIAGFKSNCLGVEKTFDCEMTDQATIQGLAVAALLGLQGLSFDETHWKAKGELVCYKFEYEQVLELAIDMKKHIEDNINQFNNERVAILNE